LLNGGDVQIPHSLQNSNAILTMFVSTYCTAASLPFQIWTS